MGWYASYLGLVPRKDNQDQHAKEQKACPFRHLPHKTAESYHGFLVYVLRTYGVLVPYLKGITEQENAPHLSELSQDCGKTSKCSSILQVRISHPRSQSDQRVLPLLCTCLGTCQDLGLESHCTSKWSSNYRELYNLVLKIKELIKNGTIQ
jgi:hypothetical protein